MNRSSVSASRIFALPNFVSTCWCSLASTSYSGGSKLRMVCQPLRTAIFAMTVLLARNGSDGKESC
jgi:hypothetical protein